MLAFGVFFLSPSIKACDRFVSANQVGPNQTECCLSEFFFFLLGAGAVHHFMQSLYKVYDLSTWIHKSRTLPSGVSLEVGFVDRSVRSLSADLYPSTTNGCLARRGTRGFRQTRPLRGSLWIRLHFSPRRGENHKLSRTRFADCAMGGLTEHAAET